MSVDVYLPFVAAAAVGLFGVRLAGRLRPAQATWLLTCGAVVTSACSTTSLLLLVWALLGRFSVTASIGDWSAAVFRSPDPVSLGVSVTAAGVLAFVCLRTSRALARHIRSIARAHRTCRRLPASLGELVVVTDDTVSACALPGRPARIVVSQRMLSALSAPERTALFAHERSHLKHRHHLHRIAVALAAAANPLLYAVPRATAYAVERWADDDAARCGAGSQAVTSAICRAVGQDRPPRSDHARRLAALRGPAQRGGWVVVTLSLVSFLGLAFMSAEATADASQLAHHANAPSSTSVVHGGSSH